MAKKRKYEDAAIWQERIDDWRRSGLTVTEFAEERGFAKSTWLKWRKALGDRGKAAPAGLMSQASAKSMLAARAPRRERRKGSAPGVTFIELPAVAQAHRSVEYGMPFEVGLRSGRRLQVPASFDAEALERLVAILEGR